MPDLFNKLGIEYSLHSNMYCPFHYNENTPAAHYHDDSNRLWCYSEQKMYGSWDLIKQYWPKVNTTNIAAKIIEKFGIETIERRIGEIEVDNIVPFLKDLKDFKTKKINYRELCTRISNYYE